MSHHVTSQLAAERQRELRNGGAAQTRTPRASGARAVPLARLVAFPGAAARRVRFRQARRAERLGC